MDDKKEQQRHEVEQDRKIAANTAAVSQMTRYLRELRDHFEPIFGMADKVPEKWRRIVRMCRLLVTVGVVGSIAFKGLGWYMKKRHLHTMADRYAQVASQLYYTEGNPDVALPFLDKALAIESESPEYIFQKAYLQGMSATRTLLNLGRPMNKAELDEAHRALAEALYLQGLDAKRPEPYILQAQIYSALKDPERARKAIEKAVEIAPDNDFALVRMALIQLEEKDVDGADKSLDRAIELNPKSKWAYLWKGIVLADYRKDPEAARAMYGKALEIDPKFDMAHYNRGLTYVVGGKKGYALAREEMLKALALNPSYKEACRVIGYLYGCEDNYTVAKVWMDKAIALDGNFLAAHKWRGVICGEMAEFDEAVKSYNNAIQLDPMNAELYERRAKIYGMQGKDEEALSDLRFAYSLNPKSARTLVYIGNAYVKAGNAEGAVSYYDKALEINPAYDEALARKAEALAKCGKNDEAMKSIDAAISATKYKPERFWLQKADMLATMKRADEALAACVKAREIAPKNSLAWRMEANLLKAKGDAVGYKSALKKYLEIVPSDAKARQELNAQ